MHGIAVFVPAKVQSDWQRPKTALPPVQGFSQLRTALVEWLLCLNQQRLLCFASRSVGSGWIEITKLPVRNEAPDFSECTNRFPIHPFCAHNFVSPILQDSSNGRFRPFQQRCEDGYSSLECRLTHSTTGFLRFALCGRSRVS